MRKSEMDVLLEMLPRYVEHVTAHPNTLITRFFGLHRVTPAGGRTVRFVVMANIFVTDMQVGRGIVGEIVEYMSMSRLCCSTDCGGMHTLVVQ